MVLIAIIISLISSGICVPAQKYIMPSSFLNLSRFIENEMENVSTSNLELMDLHLEIPRLQLMEDLIPDISIYDRPTVVINS